jgi:hypothetical protein
MSDSTPEHEYEVYEMDFGDGDLALTLVLQIPPFGEVAITGADTSDLSRAQLLSLASNWAGLWPEILDRLEAGIVDFDLPRKLENDEFSGLIDSVPEEHPMASKADVYLSLEFDEPPHWDFYLRGPRIVHSEPVA